MSNNNSGEKFWSFVVICGIIIAGMWLLEIGPFEKKQTPVPVYYNNYNVGGQPSFGGSNRGKKCHDCFLHKSWGRCPGFEPKHRIPSECEHCGHREGEHYMSSY